MQKITSIAVEPLIKTLIPGYLNNIMIKLTNVGSTDIYNLSVSISAQAQGAASITPPQLVSLLELARVPC